MDVLEEKVLGDNPEQEGETAGSPPETEQAPAVESTPPENIPYGRFQEVNSKKKEFEAQLEEKNKQVEMLTMQLLKQQSPAQMQVQPTQKPVEMPVEPNPADFAEGVYDRGYIKAVNAYDFKMNTIQREQENAVKQKETAYANNYQQHQMRAANFVAQNPDKADYYTVAESNPLVNHYTQDMARAIMASSQSPAIAYYLGTHPAEAIKIANSPVPALEIGKIEAKLSTPVATKQVSVAPQPISPVGNTNAANEKIAGKDDMPYDQYKAKMNARESAGRKAGTYGR
jgi:hypothetical protein